MSLAYKDSYNPQLLQTKDQSLEAESIWDLVKVRIVNLYGEAVFRSWFRAITFVTSDNGYITFSVPSKFIKDWIKTNYMDFIQKTWKEYDKKVSGVEFIVRETEISDHSVAHKEAELSFPECEKRDEEKQSLGIIQKPTAEIVLEKKTARLSCFDERFTFENFVVGKSNQLAYFACKKVAESPKAVAGNNPLFLYGGVGLGKTHLMHAIANYRINELRKQYPDPEVWTRKVAMQIIYLPSEKFVQEFISALTNNNMRDFKDKFRSTDLFMIDDVQFFSGKDYTQEEFFHTFNALMDEGKQLVISADRTPGDLSGIEERIRSRLGWGLVADIGSTSYELRMGILKKKVENMNLSISDEILDYLASSVETNVRELEGALNKVVAMSSLTGKEITVDLVKDLLFDMIRATHRVAITVSHIQKEVAEYYSISNTELLSQNRSRSLARPRQLAMFLCKKLTTSSLMDIARKFGGKDHSTVIHAINKIEELLKTDSILSKDLSEISQKLKNMP